MREKSHAIAQRKKMHRKPGKGGRKRDVRNCGGIPHPQLGPEGKGKTGKTDRFLGKRAKKAHATPPQGKKAMQTLGRGKREVDARVKVGKDGPKRRSRAATQSGEKMKKKKP